MKKENIDPINLTLLDYDENPLRLAKNNLIKHGFDEQKIKTICTDILQLKPELFERNGIKDAFDSISMSFLLHCVPGPMNEKFPTILNNLSCVIDEDTRLFGSCFCNPTEEMLNGLSFLRRFIICNAQKSADVDNKNDKVEDVQQILNDHFHSSYTEQLGIVTVYQATNFKRKE